MKFTPFHADGGQQALDSKTVSVVLVPRLVLSADTSTMEAVCGVNVTEVTQALASGNSQQVLIIDCRSFMAFNQGHIAESINIHCPPILKRRSGGFISLENIVPCEGKRSQLIKGCFPSVLVYDDNTQELNHASGDSILLSVIQSLLKQVDRLTVRFIIGGFEAVREECPVLCMHQEVSLSHVLRDKLAHRDRGRPDQTVPAEILPHLFLGDVCHSSQRQLLDHLGITAMLNVSSNCENFFQAHFRYMHVQVNDSMEADLLSWFPRVIDFIDSVAKQQGKVLVHCRAGVSRSATVCIAYLMQKQGMSLESALEFLISRRPIVDPNLNFIQQLQKFEDILKSQHVIMPSLAVPSNSSKSTSDPLLSPFILPDLLSACPGSSNIRSDLNLLSLPNVRQTKKESQNCMSPSPAAHPSYTSCLTATPSRPTSLLLLQNTTQTSSFHSQKSDFNRGSPFLSPSHQSAFPSSPIFNVFREPIDEAETFMDNYINVPRTPLTNHTFSFLSPDVVTCQALSITSELTSPRQCRPSTPSALDVTSTPFFGPKHSFAAVSVPHSPLSPLPSFG